jgi:hypothetical protein
MRCGLPAILILRIQATTVRLAANTVQQATAVRRPSTNVPQRKEEDLSVLHLRRLGLGDTTITSYTAIRERLSFNNMQRGLEDLVVRIGVAFAFLYPAIDEIFDPYSWIGYFPKWVHGYVPDLVLLHSFGAVEVIIALWILWGRRIFWPSLVAVCILMAIVLSDFADFQILFRDMTIAAAALALAVSRSKWGKSRSCDY